MMIPKALMLGLALLIVAAGCQTLEVPAVPASPPTAAPAAAPPPAKGLTPAQLALLEAGAGDYRIGAGDVLQLYAVDVAEINRRYVIGPDGKITLPGVGVVSLEGLTREQAAARIEGLLQPVYLKPRVNIIVEEYNNNRIFVFGEVRRPGQYSFTGRPLLLAALARAEGVTDRADLRSCTVVRGRGTLIEIDLEELLHQGDRTLNLPLLPEDVIYIKKADEEHPVYVLGEVNRPGVFLRGRAMDTVRAVALAGGETKDAKLSEVRIVRRGPDGTPTVLDVDLDGMLAGRQGAGPAIEAGDIVYVPRKGVATFNYYLSQITPSLNTVLLGIAVQGATRR